MHTLNRRQMLISTGAALAAATLNCPRRAMAAEAEIIEKKVISHRPELYHGWPTVARRKNGQLLVVCSGGREEHVCPFGWVEMMRSDDNGKTWSWPRTLMDCEIDDRDAGVMETDKGTILVTSFTSLAYDKFNRWPKEEKRLRRWKAAHNSLTAEQREKLLGSWMVRSTDGGMTWSGRFDPIACSPHGPIQLSDGRQLFAGKEMRGDIRRVGAAESKDDGQTWTWLGDVPTRKGDDLKQYHELHAVETAKGTIVAQIRNHNKTNKGETLQTESADGGKTWSEPHSIGVYGYPSHLLRLADGRLLMTFGHRRKPYGNQARLSEDNGKTWSEPMIVNGDAKGTDMGYPSTVQLDDGSLLSVWYEVTRDSKRAVLRQAKWKLKA